MEKNLFIVMVALVVWSCAKHERAAQEQAPLRVRTMVVVPQSGGSSSRYVGTIEPVHETPLSMQTSGRVTTLHVRNGAHVKKGQVLVEVDNTQAMNAYHAAKAALQHAKDGYERAKRVHDKGVIADQKMVEIESELMQAQSMYDAAKQQVEECRLTAPCDGAVNGLELSQGQSVLPGKQICTILDVSGFNVRFTVPEAEVGKLKADREKWKGTVECAAVDTVLPIVLTETGIVANPVTHTYDVVARIEGGAAILMTGMVGKVSIQPSAVSIQSSDIVIPARCVLLKPEGHTVWVVENGTAQRRDIVLDGYEADGVRVLSGIQPGDSLIIDGYQKLYNGCKVISD